MTLFSVGLIAGGALVALVVAVVAIGACLPRHHVATRSQRYAAPPDVVWARIATPLEGAAWRSGLTAVAAAPAIHGHTSWTETSRQGSIRYVEDEAVPFERRVVRIADDTLPFGGRWIFVLQPEGGGTRLTITEEGEVKNPLFRFVSAVVIGHTATIDTYLRDLARHLPSG